MTDQAWLQSHIGELVLTIANLRGQIIQMEGELNSLKSSMIPRDPPKEGE